MTVTAFSQIPAGSPAAILLRRAVLPLLACLVIGRADAGQGAVHRLRGDVSLSRRERPSGLWQGRRGRRRVWPTWYRACPAAAAREGSTSSMSRRSANPAEDRA